MDGYRIPYASKNDTNRNSTRELITIFMDSYRIARTHAPYSRYSLQYGLMKAVAKPATRPSLALRAPCQTPYIHVTHSPSITAETASLTAKREDRRGSIKAVSRCLSLDMSSLPNAVSRQEERRILHGKSAEKTPEPMCFALNRGMLVLCCAVLRCAVP